MVTTEQYSLSWEPQYARGEGWFYADDDQDALLSAVYVERSETRVVIGPYVFPVILTERTIETDGHGKPRVRWDFAVNGKPERIEEAPNVPTTEHT
jgi:hypothetical protein